jgi:hypothetical protein
LLSARIGGKRTPCYKIGISYHTPKYKFACEKKNKRKEIGNILYANMLETAFECDIQLGLVAWEISR